MPSETPARNRQGGAVGRWQQQLAVLIALSVVIDDRFRAESGCDPKFNRADAWLPS
jgi:hypothetical protein